MRSLGRRRVARVGDVVRVADRAERDVGGRTRVGPRSPPARAGAKVADVGTELGTAAGMSERCGVASCAPDAGLAGRRRPAATTAAPWPRPSPGLPVRPSAGRGLPGPTGVAGAAAGAVALERRGSGVTQPAR